MSIYNNFTKGASIDVELFERNKNTDESTWGIIIEKDIVELGRNDGRILQNGTLFMCKGKYDDEEDDICQYVQSCGILDACNMSDAEFEQKLVDPNDQLTTITVGELEELREKATKYDEMVEARRRGARKANSVSTEERKARAKKAVEARIKKYGQKRKKN